MQVARAQGSVRDCLRTRGPATAAVCRPVSRRFVAVAQVSSGKSTGNAAVDKALQVSGGIVDTLAGFVPETVPRPIAKGAVAVLGGMLVFGLVQKVVSTVFTLALLGGAAYLYFKSSSSGSGAGAGSSSSGSDGGGAGASSAGGGRGRVDDLDDPLADARRIMDKYK